MTPPPVARPARTSSVALSLANAAAALRAQEWCGSNSPSVNAHVDTRADATGADLRQRRTYADPRQAPRYNRFEAENATMSYDASYSYDKEQENAAVYDREAFYEELRERHRNLTNRQRVAREIYGQNLQQNQWQRREGEYREDIVRTATNEIPSGYRQDLPAKRQRIVVDSNQQLRRHHPPVSPADRHYRSSTYPSPPATQLASIMPRVNASAAMDRRFRDSKEMDRHRTDQQRDRSMQDQQEPRTAPSTGSGHRGASPGSVAAVRAPPVHVLDVRNPGPVTGNKSPCARTGMPKSDEGQEHSNVQIAPSVIEDLENDPENETSAMEDDGQKKQKKRVRYLRDTDRRNIIKRIEKGEKQAALAREFGVTRAAICHIKKNRFEILSRYNMLVKSAQEMDRAENFVGPAGVEMMVHEVRANSVLLLMTMLRDNRSNGATFRRVAGRLIMILLEEALAFLGTESVEVVTGSGHLYRGLELRHHFCGVAIGAEGFPFLVLFHQMEPEAPQGSIHVEAAMDRRGERVWRLDHMDLPANIVQHKVLLFSSTCSTGDAECKAIEALCSVGCDDRSISLVAILVASDGIVNISNRFPHVKIITGGIDDKVDPQTNSIIPGFGDFVSRYNGS